MLLGSTEKDLTDFLHTDKLPIIRDMLLMAVPGTPSGPLEFRVDSAVSSINQLMSQKALDEASCASTLEPSHPPRSSCSCCEVFESDP